MISNVNAVNPNTSFAGDREGKNIEKGATTVGAAGATIATGRHLGSVASKSSSVVAAAGKTSTFTKNSKFLAGRILTKIAEFASKTKNARIAKLLTKNSKISAVAKGVGGVGAVFVAADGAFNIFKKLSQRTNARYHLVPENSFSLDYLS